MNKEEVGVKKEAEYALGPVMKNNSVKQYCTVRDGLRLPTGKIWICLIGWTFWVTMYYSMFFVGFCRMMIISFVQYFRSDSKIMCGQTTLISDMINVMMML